MSLTAAQQAAVAARGNVLVMAGAGTGKTSTLVTRCIDCLSGGEPASLDELLIVTFTEAAAAEARERIRTALERKFTETGDEHWARQLALFDAAHIGTLHGFCLKLIRQHFYQLGLDPQLTVSDEGQARLLAEETLTELLEEHYAGRETESAAVLELIESYAGGRDETIRNWVLQLHHYGQTRPDPRDWLERQMALFQDPNPAQWANWLIAGIAEWRDLWLAELESLRPDNVKAAECAGILSRLAPPFDREQASRMVANILAAKAEGWPKGKKTELLEPLKPFFRDVEFLATLTPPGRDASALDPLVEDWTWCRQPMLALLRLTQQFTARFTERKRADGVVDFHDLEQLALQLLWEPAERDRPSAIARQWREQLRFVFVDEYQDINAAQDRIITALSREGAHANRFLVGDVKQSIYRFRLAAPAIFRTYAREWNNKAGKTISLAENFRSRAAILEFANALFAPLMREEIGGVNYDAAARLIPGLKSDAAPEAEVEIRLRLTERGEALAEDTSVLDDLQNAEREARHIALRLRELHASGWQIVDRESKQPRPVAWRDMAVLLRAPASKAEGYAKQFEAVGVPLRVERGGFFDALEVADLLNLLRLLDNPVQDVPLLAVLRSPLVGLSLDELATIRLTAKGPFWTALVRFPESSEASGPSTANAAASLARRVSSFLTCFARWRQLARHAALSKCLDTILAETHYAEWLRTQERGRQRQGNVQRLLSLAEQYDQFQRQGLFRFLRFVEAQREAGAEPDVATAGGEDAVHLMSIHQSKGLEFPVVVVADLGKAFNLQDLGAGVILDEEFGLCPQVRPPGRAVRYPSAVQWLARQRQQRELLGEELRLLYVALTRAREKLILSGSISRQRWDGTPAEAPLTPLALLAARNALEWLRLWVAAHGRMASTLYTLHELDDTALIQPPEAATIVAARETPLLDDKTLAHLQSVLTWDYPFETAVRRPAKTSVTALRRAAAAELEAEELFAPRVRRAEKGTAVGRLSAADVGNAHHRFLQHIALPLGTGGRSLQAEAGRLQRDGVLTAEEAAALDFVALDAFWQSSAGRRIQAQAANVKRELEFTARFTPAELDAIIHATAQRSPPGADSQPEAETYSGEVRDFGSTVEWEDFVVVQGVADLVVLLPDEIWLLDFKTDHLDAGEVEAKRNFYAPQLQLYALALERTYGRPVTERWLRFLACGVTVSIPSAPAGTPAQAGSTNG